MALENREPGKETTIEEKSNSLFNSWEKIKKDLNTEISKKISKQTPLEKPEEEMTKERLESIQKNLAERIEGKKKIEETLEQIENIIKLISEKTKKREEIYSGFNLCQKNLTDFKDKFQQEIYNLISNFGHDNEKIIREALTPELQEFFDILKNPPTDFTVDKIALLAQNKPNLSRTEEIANYLDSRDKLMKIDQILDTEKERLKDVCRKDVSVFFGDSPEKENKELNPEEVIIKLKEYLDKKEKNIEKLRSLTKEGQEENENEKREKLIKKTKEKRQGDPLKIIVFADEIEIAQKFPQMKEILIKTITEFYSESIEEKYKNQKTELERQKEVLPKRVELAWLETEEEASIEKINKENNDENYWKNIKNKISNNKKEIDNITRDFNNFTSSEWKWRENKEEFVIVRTDVGKTGYVLSQTEYEKSTANTILTENIEQISKKEKEKWEIQHIIEKSFPGFLNQFNSAKKEYESQIKKLTEEIKQLNIQKETIKENIKNYQNKIDKISLIEKEVLDKLKDFIGLPDFSSNNGYFKAEAKPKQILKPDWYKITVGELLDHIGNYLLQLKKEQEHFQHIIAIHEKIQRIKNDLSSR